MTIIRSWAIKNDSVQRLAVEALNRREFRQEWQLNKILVLDPVLTTLMAELKNHLAGKIKEVWLFGSRARGDQREDSDYDLLIIAEGNLSEIKGLVREAEWLCMERHGALVASLVYSPEQWTQRKCSPLGWNIQKEGKVVA